MVHQRSPAPTPQVSELMRQIQKPLHDFEESTRLREKTEPELPGINDENGAAQADTPGDDLRTLTRSGHFNGLPAHIALLDPAGNVVSVNEGWRQEAHKNPFQGGGDCVGQNYVELCESITGDRAREAWELSGGIRAVLGGLTNEFILEYPCPTAGDKCWFQAVVTPLNENHAEGAVVMHINITERKQAEQEAAAQMELLRMASHVGRLGAWSIELPSQKITWSEEVYRLHEVELDLELTLDRSLSFYPPASRRKLEAAIELGQPYDLELEFITAKGRPLWVRTTSTVEKKDNRIVRWYGIFQDITERKQAEKSLRESEERHRLIFQGNPVPMWVYDLETLKFLAVNHAAIAHYGYSEQEFLAMTVNDLRLPEDFAKIEQETLEAAGNGPRISRPCRHRRKDGAILEVEMSSDTMLLDERAVRLVLVSDVTERLATDRKLQQSEALLRIAGRAAKIGGWSYDIVNNHLTWSEEVTAIHELPPGSQITPEEAADFYPPEWRDEIVEAFRRCADHGEPFDGESEIVTAQGRRIWVRTMGEAERDVNGAIARLQGTFQDITETKRAELELSRINRALKMLSSCNRTLLRVENERRLLKEICELAVNMGGYRMAWIGYAQDDEFRTIKPMAHAGDESQYLSTVQLSWSAETPWGRGPAGQAIRNGQATICQDLTKDPDFAVWLPFAQQRSYRSLTCLPLSDRQRIFGVLCLYSSEIQTAGADETKFLQEMADNLAFGLVHIRAQEERRRMREAVIKVATGVSAATGSAFFEQLAQSMAEALGAQISVVSRLVPGSAPTFRTMAVWADGAIADNIDYPLADSVCENLLHTEEFVVPEEVAQKFPKYPILAALGVESYVGRCLRNSQGEVVGTLGVFFREPLQQPEFISTTLQIFASRAASEIERQAVDEKLREQASLIEKARDAIAVRDLDNHILYWNASAENLYGWKAEEVIGRVASDIVHNNADDFNQAYQHVLQHGEWTGELRQIDRSGKDLIVESRWTLMRDAQGNPEKIMAINTDVTERKKLEGQFLRAQRMESIGTLASGIAHDLNNVLAPILMAVEMLEHSQDEKEARSMLDILRTSSQHGAELVRQVLSFGRGMEGQRVLVNPAYLLQEIRKIVRDTFPKDIQFEFHPAPQLWTLTGDPTQLHQVFMNLCVNARDAMPHGGKLTVTMENVILDDVYVSMHPGFKSGSYVLIQVRDTGTGIPQAVQDKIFEPFFTTKDVGKGTGLGLSTSLTIIKSHGGFIQVSSVPNNTVFSIYLPANTISDEVESVVVPEQAQIPRGHGEVVLVVDDEENFRIVSQSTLVRYGYRVLLAAHGAEAVAIYATQHQDIALVLTDMAMPVMDGAATIVALKSINPEVKIVCSSGLSSKAGASRAAHAGVHYFIPKPYTAEVMLKVIAQALKEPAGAPSTALTS
jgi:PAS domain S-box-containing protein